MPPITVKVDPYVQHQTFKGFGTALSWWATFVGGWSPTKRTEVMDLIFGSSGLNIKKVRYNIAGGENPSCTSGSHFIEGRGMPNSAFQQTKGTWDWTADANQRYVLDTAKNTYSVDQFTAFSNTPPHWLTKDGCSAGGVNYAENLATTDYAEYAEYLADVVGHFKTNFGITFDELSPINEPLADYWKKGGSQEGNKVTLANHAAMFSAVRTALDNAGLSSVGIIAPESTSVNWTISSIRDYNSTTMSKLARIGGHTYTDGDQKDLRDAALASGKENIMSEFCTGYVSGDHTSIDVGLPLAKQIIKDITESGATEWHIWQSVESMHENLIHNQAWGLIHGVYSDFTHNSVSYTEEDYYVSKQYYCMKQFCQHLTDGYVIMETKDSNTLAAYNPTTDKLVIVAINDTTSNKSMLYDMGEFDGIGNSAVRYRTSATESYASLNNKTFNNTNKLTDTLPAKSVTTYIISSVTFTEPTVSFDPTKYYSIVNKHSGKCLNVNGWGTSNGDRIIQWDEGTPNDNTKWQITDAGGGYHYLTNKNSGLKMSVANWWLPNYTVVGNGNIEQWSGASDNQAFKIKKKMEGSNTYYYLVNKHSKKAIHIEDWSTYNGANAIQWSHDGADNASFSIIER